VYKTSFNAEWNGLMRKVYSILLYLLIPFILARLLWRSIKAPEYRQRWFERFAFYRNQTIQNVVWFHAVSVGEAEALFPLLQRYQHQYPDRPILVTTMTPTGSARVKTVMKDTVSHVYLPYDLPDAIGRFMKAFTPVMAVIMETEIWPNLFAHCSKQQIPLYIINARLTEKSVQGYKKFPDLIRYSLARVNGIAAQTRDDAKRFIDIGAPTSIVKTYGNLKFDIEISSDIIESGQQIKQELFNSRFVWLVASTHNNEELLFLNLYKKIKQKIPELLMVLVPRHPERFDSVEKLCVEQQLDVIRRTSKQACTANSDIYLGDTMGELKILYAAADVAFVGGSMVPAGGHNVLEPAAIGVPILFGPFMENFNEIAEKITDQESAIQCRNAEEVFETICKLYRDVGYRQALVENSKQFVKNNQGTITKILRLINQEL
jgi:3-deoxy-D-manno-octulosonic-acid transferase